jgi:hypothetical protein
LDIVNEMILNSNFEVIKLEKEVNELQIKDPKQQKHIIRLHTKLSSGTFLACPLVVQEVIHVIKYYSFQRTSEK